MIEKRVQYATEPPEVEFFELPGGLADVWIARNVEKVEDVADNGPDPADAVPCVYYTADVAYHRGGGLLRSDLLLARLISQLPRAGQTGRL